MLSYSIQIPFAETFWASYSKPNQKLFLLPCIPGFIALSGTHWSYILLACSTEVKLKHWSSFSAKHWNITLQGICWLLFLLQKSSLIQWKRKGNLMMLLDWGTDSQNLLEEYIIYTKFNAFLLWSKQSCASLNIL